jgi:hypothetical protein
MKTVKYILVAFVLFFAAPAAANVVSDSSVRVETEARVKQLTQRLAEVKAIDRSTLTNDEKKALRQEKKELKKELKVISGGVYISVGALILILILLIILL